MITKNYIVDSELPINANVSDNKVNPYLSPARKQLKEILDADLYSALQSLYDDGVKEWSKNNSYSTDDKVIHSELGELKMWKAAQDNSNSEPTTANAANWDELDLGTFLVGYVQPFLAHHVFYAYAVNGGVNITHQGLQVVSNETAQPLGGSALQSFLNYWKSEQRPVGPHQGG